MKKVRASDFKKGDRVVYLDAGYFLRVVEATVTQVRLGVVHVIHVTERDYTFKRSFSEIPGKYRENPYPLWQLLHIESDAKLKNLQKRATKCARNFSAHQTARAQIESDVDAEARKWKWEEIDRRVALLPHGRSYVERVCSRMGFKKPKNNN